MSDPRALKIGITCYPTVGGSGILASALGVELARRGHQVHFISYERPFRIPADLPGVFFHPVEINDYELFKYPDYTLPLSVQMAKVSRTHRLDILHVHYAVPHATAALLARDMLPMELRPKVVATLHGTDTTLLGRDPNYAPAIRHALEAVDAVTTVSDFLRRETVRLLGVERSIEVIHNFFSPTAPERSGETVRAELGLAGEPLIVHLSNLRPGKRIDLLLQTLSRLRDESPFKLLVLAGGDFAPYWPEAKRLGLQDRILVRNNVFEIEEYLQVADFGLFTSESESFCLSLLECMAFGVPSVSTSVGGVPEVVDHDQTGLLAPFGNVDELARLTRVLLNDPERRVRLGRAAQAKAFGVFSADQIVPRYLSLYARLCGQS